MEKEIDQPIISFPYGEEFGNVVYRMHRYWGRKPANVINQYIKTYCPENGIVLDPFLGGGTTGIEAIKLKRKIIGIDINPLAIFITKTTLSPVRLVPLESAYNSLFHEIVPLLSHLYETRCTECRKKGYISYVVFRNDNWETFENEIPQKIYYQCSCSSKTLQKNPDYDDLDRIKQTSAIKIHDWYPKDFRLPQIRPGRREAKKITDLFTKRNLFSLSKIYKIIFEMSSGIIRDCLLMAFSSSLPQCSRLSGVERKNGKYSAMGWILTSFRIMPEHIERNPLLAFRHAFTRVIKGKQESNRMLGFYKEAGSVEDIVNNKATGLIVQGAVEDIPEILKGHSVDYVFTDPPHGHSIQYMKLSSISNAWLKFVTSSEKEIIQEKATEAARERYEEQIIKAFGIIRSITSKNSRFHIYFRGKKENEMLSAASLLVKSGFKFVRALFQPQRVSFRTTFRGKEESKAHISPPGDWIMHLKRECGEFEIPLTDSQVEKLIVEKAEEVLTQRGQPTQLQSILLYVASLIPSYLLAEDADIIRKILEKNVGGKFIVEKNAKSDERREALWWLLGQEKCEKSLDNEVEKIVSEKLVGREEVGASSLYLYQAIYSKFSSTKTPDQETIEKVLTKVAEERGIEKKYYLKEEYMEKKEFHSRLVLALMRLGIQNKFKVFISPSAIERIKESELGYELESIVKENSERIVSSDELFGGVRLKKYPNVLWEHSGRVHAHFEVEDSKSIPETTFQKGDIVRKKYPESERVLVIPHKLINSINQELKEKKSFWHVAPYHNILFSDDPSTYKPVEEEEGSLPAGAEPLKLEIVSKRDIPNSIGEIVAFKIKLKCPADVLKRVKPGHFLQVEINGKTREYFSNYHYGNSYLDLKGGHNGDPKKLEFARIPLSIHRVYYEKFEPAAFKTRSINFLPHIFWDWIQRGEMTYLDLLIRIIGPGTKTLYKMKEGEKINAVGPLGKAIKFPAGIKGGILISGGVGLASLYPIAHYLRERGYPVVLFAGARDKRTLSNLPGGVLHEFSEMGVECNITDETADRKMVTDLFREKVHLKSHVDLDGRHVFSCGPWEMLREVNSLAEKFNIPCTVLIDRLMLCGVGACMSCVVKNKEITENGDSKIYLSRACLDGPAFDGRNIVWD